MMKNNNKLFSKMNICKLEKLLKKIIIKLFYNKFKIMMIMLLMMKKFNNIYEKKVKRKKIKLFSFGNLNFNAVIFRSQDLTKT